MTLTRARTLQYIGILFSLMLIAVGYWYFAVRAGVKTNTSGSQPQGMGDLSASLSGYWRLDEGSGTSAADSSANAIASGTLTNGPTWTTGQIGSGVDFDGTDDYVTVADSSYIELAASTDDLALSGWFNRDTFTTDDTIIAKRNGITAADTGYIVYVDDATDQLIFEISDGTNEYQMASTTTFTSSGWHHFVVVFDETSAALTDLYIDGASNAPTKTGTITNVGASSNAVAFRIGAESDAGNPFDGKIDEIRIYKERVFLSDEVASLYRLTTPTDVDTGLKAYSSFDGGQIRGTYALDRSGSDNGYVLNGPVAAEGRVGQALNFDGVNDYGNASSDASIDDLVNLSACAWIYPETLPTWGAIISKRWEFEVVNNPDDVLTFYFPFSGTDGEWSTPAGSIVTNKWQHVCVTYNRSSTANDPVLYIDGVSAPVTEAATPTGTADADASEDLLVGSWYGGSYSDFFDGSIDEPRVYSRILSAAEVKSLYDRGASDRLSSGATQFQGSDALSAGLIGYWKLDENTGTSAADSSTNAITALTLTNGPTWTTGQIGSGIDFDGTNDYATTADNDLLDFADGETFTVTGWFNRDTAATNDFIVSKSNNATSGFRVGFDSGSTNYLGFLVSDGSDFYTYSSYPTTYTTAGWHHFAAVWGDTYMKLYVDGQDIGAWTQGTIGNVGSLANSEPFRIGAKSNGNDPFDGKIDEVRVYDRALSPDEVSSLYRTTVPTTVDTSLKGYWSFNGDAVSGTTAYDWSGAGNTGTLTNGPTVKWGRVGQALSFDGTNDYLNMGSATTIDNLNPISICAWVKPDTIGDDPRIYAKADANGLSGVGINLTGTTNRFQFRHGWSGNGAERWDTADNSITLGVWQYLCATYDGSSLTNDPVLYIDGNTVPITEIVSPSGTLSSDASFDAIIGNRPDTARPFDGEIDEVRLYNRILSAAEVKSLYDRSAPDKTNTSVSTPQGTGRLDSGLAGYWKLDENTGTSASDASTGGNTGTLTNGPTWTTGQIGSAVNFDGTNDYIAFATKIPRKGSISVWVDTTEAMSLCTYSNVFSTAVPGSHIQLQFNSCSVGFNNWMFLYRGNYGTYADVSGPTYTSTSQYQGWHHLTATWDDVVGASLYIDGTLAGSSTTTTDVMDDATAATGYIGSDSGTQDYYSGKIDEVRLYNRMLSADEVAQLYRVTAPTGTDTGLKGYWSFNGQDISGTTAYDRSGAGNDGTLTNGPTVKWGKLGQALQFDGSNDYVTMGDIAVLDGVTAMTASAWAKIPVGMSAEQHIIDKAVCSGATDSGTFELWHSTGDGGKPSFTFYKNGGSPADYRATSSVEIDDDQWHLVTGTYDGTAVRIYVDGVETGSTTATSITAPSTAYAVEVGGRCNGNPFYWSGSIDEVRLYNRALSASEIKALFGSGK